MIVELRFINKTSSQIHDLKVDRLGAMHVARWYGAYCAGDDYEVAVNGQVMNKDLNGEIDIP